ncbi:MAG: hypothetical protein K6F05_05550 [Succinivibrio sp.]|nr:hypothetical protein [Succinivibrio sp.]
MDVGINNQVSSQYTQVIQSVHNRRRIDEQQNLEQDNEQQKQVGKQQEELQPKEIEPAIKAADNENFEQVYQSASQFFKGSSENSYGASAYQKVQDQAHRDDLQSMLGFSVYA